jgi:hypothetical protein
MFSISSQGAWRRRDPLALTGKLGAREIALTPDSAAGPWSEMAMSLAGKLGFLEPIQELVESDESFVIPL